MPSTRIRLRACLLASAGAFAVLCFGSGAPAVAKTKHRAIPKVQHGTASVYSRQFEGKKMANGERFSTASNAAASKTLPLNSKASVTNLETGKRAEVTVKDRGKLPHSRILDVSPKTANQLGISQQKGVAPVRVVSPAR